MKLMLRSALTAPLAQAYALSKQLKENKSASVKTEN